MLKKTHLWEVFRLNQSGNWGEDMIAKAKSVGRQSGLDALRVLSAVLITAIHYIGYSDVLNNAGGGNKIWIVAVYSLTRIAVGEYILTMGYFMSQKKATLKKVVLLDSRVILYSIIIAAVCVLLKINTISIPDGLRTVFPLLTDAYWFFTAYILLYTISPLLNEIFNRCSRKKIKVLLCTTWTIITIDFKLNPFTTGDNYLSGAHGIVWLSFLYMVGAALYRFPDLLSKRVCRIAAIISYAVIFLGYWFGFKPPKTVSFFEDCAVFPSILTICTFAIFKDVSLKGMAKKIIGLLAPLSLGVYLVQEQCLLREAYWSFFNADEMVHSAWMPIQFMCALILPWIAAAVIEKVHGLYWTRLGNVLFNKTLNRLYELRNKVCEGK